MKHLLVPVGSSKNILSHLQYAVDFAESIGAKLFVVQVYNVYTKAGTMIKVDEIIERESLAYLNDLVSKLQVKKVPITVKVFKGKLIDTLELVCKSAAIDLILIEPRTNSIKEAVFLGKTSGKIIKQTQIPSLIVPEGYKFKPVARVLFAVKSAIMRKEDALQPLAFVKTHFQAIVDLLLVKTPYYTPNDFEIKEDFKTLVNHVTKTENATTFQGVLQHLEVFNPDMLCVVRRKRGFFTKKWEKNVILKKDFSSKIPVLVLRGMK